MIKAIIFDFFGVLMGQGFDATYRYAGGDPDQDREFVSEILGLANAGLISGQDFVARISKQIGITPQAYEVAVRESEKLNEPLLKIIKELRNTYKVAILSNVNKGVLEIKLGEQRLHDDFDAVVASADVGYAKPQPEIYELAAQELSCKVNECIFIDDAKSNCDAAKGLGMHAIQYKSLEQLKRDLDALLDQS